MDRRDFLKSALASLGVAVYLPELAAGDLVTIKTELGEPPAGNKGYLVYWAVVASERGNYTLFSGDEPIARLPVPIAHAACTMDYAELGAPRVASRLIGLEGPGLGVCELRVAYPSAGPLTAQSLLHSGRLEHLVVVTR